MLETWFWCLSPGFWAWEIHWDHFQTPQNDLSGRNGHFRPFMATHGHSNYHKMAKFVTLVLSMLETWFWCPSPGFWAWKIHWDHFQAPQIDLSGRNGHLWPISALFKMQKKIQINFWVQKNTSGRAKRGLPQFRRISNHFLVLKQYRKAYLALTGPRLCEAFAFLSKNDPKNGLLGG